MQNLENYIAESVGIFSSLNLTFLSEFLLLSEIILDKDIPSARIEKDSGRFRIRINPDFLSEYCDTPYKFTALLLHEIFHHLLGHLGQRFNMIKNIAADAIINSLLYQIDKRLGALFKELYQPDEFPELLLRPDSQPQDEETDQIYHYLWQPHIMNMEEGETCISLPDLISFLERKLKQEPSVFLLGSHNETEKDAPIFEDIDEELIQNQNIKSFLSQSPLHQEFLEDIKKKIEKRYLKAMEKALIHALLYNLNQNVINFSEEKIQKSVVPARLSSRKDIFLLAEGFYPTFFRIRSQEAISGRVNIYIDVSGSVRQKLPFIYALLKQFSSYLAPEIYLFSEEVVRINKEQLFQNEILTTMGTSFDCVAEHLLENQIKKALLITDGIAEIDPQLAEEVKEKVDLICLLVNENRFSPVYKFCRKVFILPEGMEGYL